MTSLELELHRLECDCDRSGRYHMARSAFLDKLHRVLMMVVIISGSATFASLSETLNLSAPWTAIVAALAPFAGVGDLVWAYRTWPAITWSCRAGFTR